MGDPAGKEPASATGGSFRRGYVLSVIAASAAICGAGLCIGVRPTEQLPTVGQMLIGFGLAAAATGLLFGFRLATTASRAVRYAVWGLLLAAAIVLAFGMSISTGFGVGVVRLLGLAGRGGVAVLQTASRTAGLVAAAGVGSIASFLWSTLLDLQKYHTFLCVRLMRVRITNYLVTLAVAGSVFVLIVVLSVMWGFDRDLQSRIRGTLAPVSIEAVGSDRVTDYDPLIDWIKADAELGELVTECAPYVQCFALLTGPEYKTHAVVRGIDIQRERVVGDIGKYLMGGKTADFLLDGEQPPKPGIIVGCVLAESIRLRDNEGKLRSGTQVALSPLLSIGFINPPTFTVVGQFESGHQEYDSRFAYVPISEAQSLAGYDYNEASGISVALKHHSTADRVKELLVAKLKPDADSAPIYSVKTWAEQCPNLLKAVHIERVVMAVILGSLIALAGLFVCAVMLMAVKEKTRDIGIVKAVGGTVTGIMEIFLINGFVIGVLGAALGGTGGLLCVKYINGIITALHLQGFVTGVFYLNELPTYVDPVGVAMILCAAVAVSLLAAMVPSLMAARLNPVEALRYE